MISENIAVRIDSDKPAAVTYFIASEDSYPLQFLMKSSDLIFDIEEDDYNEFKVKDFIWFCLRPGGFILSLSQEELGYFEGLMGDLIRNNGEDIQMLASNLFKPSVQEKMYKNWGLFFKYLKDNSIIKSTVYSL